MANLRKKEKTNGIVGAKKQGTGRANIRKKGKNEWIIRGYKQGAG